MNRVASTFLTLLAALIATFSIPALASGEPTEIIRYHGDGSSATGAALANAEKCDVNGDGLDDAVVGAWFWDKAPLSNIGAAYVILGDPAPKGGSLNNPATAGAVRIDGPAVANAFVGFAVGCLGDVNGDGFDDVGISYYTAQKAFVVFGSEDFTPVDLGLLGSRGFEVRGNSSSGNVGFSLAPVGDLNGDGLDEFGVAEVVADTLGRTNNGRIWVISGQDDIADVDLTNPASGQIHLTVEGAYSEERLGVLSEVGDVNGDGKDDFLVGSYTSTPWGSAVAVPGSAAVIWGGTTGQVDLASLGSNGFRIYGPTRGRDRLGISVSGAGDLNGDGKADLVIGADGVFNAATGNRNGSAFVVFGSASNATVYTSAPANDTMLPGPGDVTVFTCEDDPGTGTCTAPADVTPRGYRITGVANNDSTAYSVAGIGDVSGDGTPDLAIGAYGYDPVNPANPPATMSGAGAVWIVHGKSGTAPQSLAALSPAEGYRIDGLAAGDRMGRQVGSFGDFDGNGKNDFVAGGDFASRPLAPGTPLSQAGEIIVGLNGALATETSLEVSPTGSAPLGQQYELVASAVRIVGGGGDVESGSFGFTVDGSPIGGCESVPASDQGAVCEALPTTRGEHVFAVEYSGTPGEHLASSSEAEPVTLIDTTDLSLASSSESVTVGRPVTFTATVEPSRSGPSVSRGTVSFAVDGETVEGCGTSAVDSNVATCVTELDEVGEYEIEASYTGSAELEGSTADPITQEAVAAPVAVVEFSRDPVGTVRLGDQVTLRAAVWAAGEAADHGSVDFRAGGVPVSGCSAVELEAGKATCVASFARRGRIELDAAYEPDTVSIVASASDPVALDVRDTTSVTSSADVAEVRVGQKLTVVSRVEAAAGGSVDEGSVRLVTDGCIGCGSAAVSAGSATHSISFDRPGTYTLAGDYSGGVWLEDSSAAPLTVKVTAVPACKAVRPRTGKPRFSAKGRALSVRVAASSSSDVTVTPVIRFTRKGNSRTITLTARTLRVDNARKVAFKLTAAQARRLPRRASVVVKLRAKPVAADCVPVLGSTIAKSFGRLATGKTR